MAPAACAECYARLAHTNSPAPHLTGFPFVLQHPWLFAAAYGAFPKTPHPRRPAWIETTMVATHAAADQAASPGTVLSSRDC